MKKYRNYWTYSVGCFVVWGVILVVRAVAFGGTSTTHDVLFVFAGWCIAWVSTTIARSVYPPPKRWLEPSTPIPEIRKNQNWWLAKGYLALVAQSVALDFALTFKDVPPVQKAATFTIDDALAKMVDIGGGQHN